MLKKVFAVLMSVMMLAMLMVPSIAVSIGDSQVPLEESPGVITAIPADAPILLDDADVAFNGYNIADENYFKIRDIAMKLNGTDKQFAVEYDAENNAIVIVTGEAYVEVGGEMAPKATANADAKLADSKVVIDGEEVEFTAYNIADNNYFRLRDIAQAIDFKLEWDAVNKTIVIDTTEAYVDPSAGDDLPLPGGYSEDRELEESDLELFESLTADIEEATYEPTLVATQVVAGMNYRFTATATPADVEEEPYEVYIYIFVPLEGDPELVEIVEIVG